MSREVINPDSMYSSVQFGFSHAVKSSSQTTVHCAGQVAWNSDCEVVGVGDLGAQARQSLQNLKTVLAEAGATIDDVVRIRTYVVNYTPACIEPIGAALGEFYGDLLPATNTLIGVQALAMPEFLIEIEAVAMID